jgi:hypothetical protein
LNLLVEAGPSAVVACPHRRAGGLPAHWPEPFPCNFRVVVLLVAQSGHAVALRNVLSEVTRTLVSGARRQSSVPTLGVGS